MLTGLHCGFVGLALLQACIVQSAPASAADAPAGIVMAVNGTTDPPLSPMAEIAANAPVAVRQAKAAITNGLEVDRRTGLMIEIAAYNQTVPTADRREGVRAALERRPPKFTGS